MWSEVCRNGSVICYDDTLLTEIEPRLFNVSWLRSNGYLAGTSQGRSAAFFIEYEGISMALRHFPRSGLVGRVNYDHFLRLGSGDGRAFREFVLLQEMRGLGLHVPRPPRGRLRAARSIAPI